MAVEAPLAAGPVALVKLMAAAGAAGTFDADTAGVVAVGRHCVMRFVSVVVVEPAAVDEIVGHSCLSSYVVVPVAAAMVHDRIGAPVAQQTCGCAAASRLVMDSCDHGRIHRADFALGSL